MEIESSSLSKVSKQQGLSTMSEIYTPLEPFKIRLLKLLPSANFEAPIMCHVITSSLPPHRNAQEYETVSYVWGYRKPERPIILNGHCFKVSRNIEMMLRYFRLRDAERTLWIDALCIDQSNTEDRNSQVRMMRDIYAQCSRCLAWLLEYKRTGEDNKDWPVLEACIDGVAEPIGKDQWDEKVQHQMEQIGQGIDIWKTTFSLFLKFVSQTTQGSMKKITLETSAMLDAWTKAVDENGEKVTTSLLDSVSSNKTNESENGRDENHGRFSARATKQTAQPVDSDGSDTDEREMLVLCPGDPSETYQAMTEAVIQNMRELGRVFSDPSIWNRIWTMQELVNSPSVTLIGGQEDTRTVNLFCFSLFFRLEMLESWRKFIPVGLVTVQDVLDIISFRGVKKVAQQRSLVWALDSVIRFRDVKSLRHRASLWDVLQLFHENKASDPRDCVYGLLGLVTVQHGITVDYGKSIAEVFMEATVSILNTSRNLDVLCQMTLRPLPSKMGLTIDLDNNRKPCDESFPPIASSPSWVPDFSADLRYGNEMGVLFAGNSGKQIYSAGSSKLRSQGIIQPIYDRYLRLKIVVLGFFESDEVCVNQSKTMEAARMLPGEWLQEYEDGFSILNDVGPDAIRYQQTGESAFQAYWRTLLRDCKAEFQERLDDEDISRSDAPFWELLRYCQSLSDGEHDAHDSDAVLQEKWEKLPSRVSRQWYLTYGVWRFACTANKLYTMVQNVKRDDLVVVADGAKVPLVLRREDGQARKEIDGLPVYSLVGTAYVHGFMDGEALEKVGQGVKHEQTCLLR